MAGARGVKLVERVIAAIESGKVAERFDRVPMPADEIDALTLSGKPLPPGLRRWLAFDAQAFDLKTALSEPMRLGDLAAREFDDNTGEMFRAFESLLPGACYLVAGGSDSRCFLYAGEPDEHGEFPIFTLDTDDAPLVCLEEPGFDVFIANVCDLVKNPGSYAGRFDDPDYRDAMEVQARNNFEGLKSIDLGGDVEHVDGDEAAQRVVSRLAELEESEAD